MGGGNINKKKSWDPTRKQNQEKVWKAERQALEERKHIEEKRKEIAESRRAEERLPDAPAKGKYSVQKVDWMYSPAATDSVKISPEMERYLLGTKETTKVVPTVIYGGGGKGQPEGKKWLQGTANLVREDPLLALKKELGKEKRSKQIACEIKSERKMKDELESYRTDHRDKHCMKIKREKHGEESSGRARRLYRSEQNSNHPDDHRQHLKG
jgi:hypothetical protein